MWVRGGEGGRGGGTEQGVGGEEIYKIGRSLLVMVSRSDYEEGEDYY